MAVLCVCVCRSLLHIYPRKLIDKACRHPTRKMITIKTRLVDNKGPQNVTRITRRRRGCPAPPAFSTKLCTCQSPSAYSFHRTDSPNKTRAPRCHTSVSSSFGFLAEPPGGGTGYAVCATCCFGENTNFLCLFFFLPKLCLALLAAFDEKFLPFLLSFAPCASRDICSNTKYVQVEVEGRRMVGGDKG